MQACMSARLALFAALGLASLGASAQDAKKGTPPNPAGAAAGNWSQSVKRDAAIAGEEFDKKQMELIQNQLVFQPDHRAERCLHPDQRRQ